MDVTGLSDSEKMDEKLEKVHFFSHFQCIDDDENQGIIGIFDELERKCKWKK